MVYQLGMRTVRLAVLQVESAERERLRAQLGVTSYMVLFRHDQTWVLILDDPVEYRKLTSKGREFSTMFCVQISRMILRTFCRHFTSKDSMSFASLASRVHVSDASAVCVFSTFYVFVYKARYTIE